MQGPPAWHVVPFFKKERKEIGKSGWRLHKASKKHIEISTFFLSLSPPFIALPVIGKLSRLDFLVCSSIVSIGMDHMDVLGNSVNDIAAEKAGVMAASDDGERQALKRPRPGGKKRGRGKSFMESL